MKISQKIRILRFIHNLKLFESKDSMVSILLGIFIIFVSLVMKGVTRNAFPGMQDYSLIKIIFGHPSWNSRGTKRVFHMKMMPGSATWKRSILFIAVILIFPSLGKAQVDDDYKAILSGFGEMSIVIGRSEAFLIGVNAEIPLSRNLTLKTSVGTVTSADIWKLPHVDDNSFDKWTLDWNSDKTNILLEAGVKYYKNDGNDSHGLTSSCKIRYLQTHIRGTHMPCYEWNYYSGTFLFWEYGGWEPVVQKENSFLMTDHQITLVVGLGFFQTLGKKFILSGNLDMGFGAVIQESDTYDPGIPMPKGEPNGYQPVTGTPSTDGYKYSGATMPLNIGLSVGYILY